MSTNHVRRHVRYRTKPAEALGGLKTVQIQSLTPISQVRQLKPAAAGNIINNFIGLARPPNPTSNDVSAALSAGTRQAINNRKGQPQLGNVPEFSPPPLIHEVLLKHILSPAFSLGVLQ